MTVLLVSTVRRRTPPTEPSGYLYTVDLESQQVLRRSNIIEPAYRGLDPNPRGGMRGSKGISVRNDQIAIANSMIVFRYDPKWNLLGFTTHPACAGIHDILFQDDTLWVTSTRTDMLFQFDLFGKLQKYYYIREFSTDLGSLNWRPPLKISANQIHEGSIDFRDPTTHREEETDNAHVNSLAFLPDGSCLISLGFIIGSDYTKLVGVKKSLIRLGVWPVVLEINRKVSRLLGMKHKRLDEAMLVRPVKAHSAVINISPNEERSLCLTIPDMTAPSHSLQVLQDNTVVYLDTTNGTVVHFEPHKGDILSITKVTDNFLRGVTKLSKRSILLGSNGQLITFDLITRRIIDQFQITQDPKESVFSFKELPSHYKLPPLSFAEHFTDATGYKDSAALIESRQAP